ncbi:uncharacterized protein L3040_009338 [Drepanopeziza brunnea f. sp. 'multigermtubi']|uniref:uncharacterized protein n=1 Tax=Drepanopeziza brunnea f. sp. 'multigermtubi' TaxID=698441 RepID=UPI0023A7282C|nr:hypothetical protein L3040_009338 [Drepanopeziza brunnea f. sp. 'multigermtubi']
MMLPLQSLSSILLASSLLFSGVQGIFDKREVIGYRVVADSQAQIFNENNRPHRNKMYDGEEFRRFLTTGFYLSNDPNRWQAGGGESYCVIKANSKKLKEFSKDPKRSCKWLSQLM